MAQHAIDDVAMCPSQALYRRPASCRQGYKIPMRQSAASQPAPDARVRNQVRAASHVRRMLSYVSLRFFPIIAMPGRGYIGGTSIGRDAWNAARTMRHFKERNMQTVRISPVEVQVGVVVYLFSNADIADGFYALASQGGDASRIDCKCLALCSRPVDCDHELGSLHD